jgi:Amt family ammonium transporter
MPVTLGDIAGHPPIDVLWVLVAAALVFSMQGGFCCLESGLVRAKNSINVAVKNLLDFCLAGSLFWLLGYGLMFGKSYNGWIGTNGFLFGNSADAWALVHFLFQLTFCGTAVTIISGAVAERTRLSGYLWIAAITTLAIYPVIGHWVWSQTDTGQFAGWLGGRGFVDFAGSTVVHSVGGWVALAAVIVIGPRLGRFDSEQPIQGHDVPFAALGVIILWFGWFGFNGGSAMGVTDRVPGILLNTTLAAMMSGISATALSWAFRSRVDISALMNGILTGLVAITASCHAVSPLTAAIIGLLSGGVCLLGMALLERLRIDDAVGAVPVHLGGGIWGTMALAIFGDPELLGTGHSRMDQLGIQALGVAACGAWAFGISFSVFWLTHRWFPLRVSEHDEKQGLNITEHGASTALIDLVGEMEQHRVSSDTAGRATVEPHTEVGQIATQYNRVLEAVHDQTAVAQSQVQIADAARLQAESARSELAKKIEMLDNFNVKVVGREERMVELKREINALCDQLNLPKRYSKTDDTTS